MFHIVFLSNYNKINIYSDCYSYSYSVINTCDRPIEVIIDLAEKSRDMVFMPVTGNVIKVIQPREIEFLAHAIADPNKETFLKKCSVNVRYV